DSVNPFRTGSRVYFVSSKPSGRKSARSSLVQQEVGLGHNAAM
ncbi:uncharacterized, partial [Tachysurus ichikawai]